LNKKKTTHIQLGVGTLSFFRLIKDINITKLITNINGDLYLNDPTFDKITVYLNFPFKRFIQVELFPPYENETPTHFWVGYIFWQITQVYTEVYQFHSKKAGVYKHTYNDLTFFGGTIDEQGIMSVEVDSYQYG